MSTVFTDQDPEIIGFDLGHGESALTWTRMSPQGDPKPLQVLNSNSLITAVGLKEDGKILLGEEVILFSSMLIESYERFKDPGLDNHPTAGKATRLFIKGIVEKLKSVGGSAAGELNDFNQAIFYVGCPSGWTPPTRKRYRALLTEAGLPNVEVVPESRAAFLFSRETRALSEKELSKKILLIDIGSSTTDFTVSDNLNEHPIDFGHNSLGGGLLDQFIFDRTVAQSPNPTDVKKYLEAYPGIRSELDLRCRSAKHQYFSLYAGKGKDVKELIKAGETILEITLNDEIMDELLQTPLDTLGGLSWQGALRGYLSKAREDMGGSPNHVIVTGGAARMPVVPQLVETVFPGIKQVIGKQPELAISCGLAYYGRAQLNSRHFQNEVDRLIQGSTIDNLVSAAIPSLYSKLATALARGIVRDVIHGKVEDWRSSRTKTLRELEEQIEAGAMAWLKDRETKKRISQVVASWLEGLTPKIKALTEPICVRHGLDASALEIKPETHLSDDTPKLKLASPVLDDLDGFTTVLSLIVSTVVAMVVGGGGLALFNLPLFGQVAAGVIAFIVLWIGKDEAKEKAEEWAKDQNFWGPLRPLIVTDAKAEKICLRAREELYSGIKKGIEKADREAEKKPDGKTLAEKITAQIEAGLQQRAVDSILLFEGKSAGITRE